MPDEVNRLVTVVLTTSDFDRSVNLYRDAFGLALRGPRTPARSCCMLPSRNHGGRQRDTAIMTAT